MDLAQVFKIDKSGVKVRRGLEVLVALVVPLVVMGAMGLDRYWLSFAFAMLFTALSDLGGNYPRRLEAMAAVGILGGVATTLGFVLGGGPWGLVVAVSFVLVLLAGLSLKLGKHGFVSGRLLVAWFLVAISESAGAHSHPASSGWWQQSLAWWSGAFIWIALTAIFWLARGRKAQAPNFPEIPTDTTQMRLSRPLIMFAIVQALAVSISVAIAFGLHLPNADWMPIATLVAMKVSLDESVLAAEQRVAGTVVGAALAAVVLLTVHGKHALEVLIVVLAGIAASIRGGAYAFYCAAIAGLVLIAIDEAHPTNYSAEGRRILFTLAGVVVGIAVHGVAILISKYADRPKSVPA
jgi:uncharacterized membrane protein YccC